MTDVPASRHTLRILKYLARQGGPTPASRVARELEIPRSTVYQIIRVMQSEGFVVHFPEERAYGLASLVHELSNSSVGGDRLERLATPLLGKLLTRMGLPLVAHLSILHGPDVVYVAKRSAHRAPTLTTDVGVHLRAHSTATGRAILAYLTKEQVRALYPDREAFQTAPERGPHSGRDLDDLLAQARERGWASESGEVMRDHSSLAVATLDHNDYPTASVGVTYRSSAVDVHQVPQLASALQITASALSMRLRGKI